MVETTGYVNVKANSPDQMKIAVQSSILSVVVDASRYEFQTYTSGIFTSTSCGTNLNHTANIVGWGVSDEGMEYWIMRNLWGTSWGDQGYMKLEIVDGQGLCGIQSEPLYPVVV